MGKITVKHYLEKRVKEIQSAIFNPKWGINNDNENMLLYFDEPKTVYPVYLQITINRQTTKIRSFTKNKLTVEDFEEYTKTGKSKYELSSRTLKQELVKVEKIIDYTVNTKRVDYKKYDLRTLINFYSRTLEKELYQWAYIFYFRDVIEHNSDIYVLRNYIDKKVNPKQLINDFKKIFNFDFEVYLDEDAKMFIDAFDLLVRSIEYNGIKDFETSIIYWFTDEYKVYFRTYMMKQKLNLAQRELNVSIIEEFTKGIEDCFLSVVDNKREIEYYDNM